MVHQKYKLKFFHYQGLSFIFLHKVHVEAEMQELRLPLLWKQCYTDPAKERACYTMLPGFSARIRSSIVRAGVAGWSGRDPCGRPPHAGEQWPEQKARRWSGRDPCGPPPRFASRIIRKFDQKG